jgi:hypothetical protein
MAGLRDQLPNPPLQCAASLLDERITGKRFRRGLNMLLRSPHNIASWSRAEPLA